MENQSLLIVDQKTSKNSFFLLFSSFWKISLKHPFFSLSCLFISFIYAVFNYNVGLNVRELTLRSFFSKKTKEEKENLLKQEFEKFKKEVLSDKDKEKINITAISEEAKIAGENNAIKQSISTILDFEKQENDLTIFKKNDFRIHFDYVIGKREFKDRNVWKYLFGIFILLFIFKSSISILNFFWLNYCYRVIEKDLKNDLLNSFFKLKFPFSSLIVSRIQNLISGPLAVLAEEIWKVPHRFVQIIFIILLYIFKDFSFGEKESINWPFLLIYFFILLVLVSIFTFLFRKAAKIAVKNKEHTISDNKIIFEILNNLEYIKLASGEQFELQRIEKILELTLVKNKKTLLSETAFVSVPNWLIVSNTSYIFFAIATVLGSLLIINPTDKAFIFSNFVEYLQTIKELSAHNSRMIDLVFDLDELTSILKVINSSFDFKKIAGYSEEKGVEKKASSSSIATFDFGDIQYKDVSFSYPGTTLETLKQWNFIFQRGKSYGIFGKNGAGKSTITKTLMKLFDLDSGQITIAEQDLKEIDSVELHKNICFQSNKPALFALSVSQNIYYPYPLPENYKQDLSEIAKKANLEEFFSEKKRFPEGFDTILNTISGTTKFSEGQKQQLAAMRIFIKNYDIYIFDEILSNVSPDLRKKILFNIFEHLQQTSAITILIDHHYDAFDFVDEVYQFTKEGLIKIREKKIINQD